VVHVLLEGTIEVGEGFGATSKPKTLAEVVTTLGAEATVVAHDTRLDGYSLADHEVLNTGTNRGHDAGGFVTEDHGGLEGEIPVPAMHIIMDCQKSVSTRGVGTGMGQGGDVRSLPQRPVATTLTWASFWRGGQRVRSS